MAASDKSINMDEFNKFIDEQNIQYEIEIDCLRDSFVTGGISSVIALAKSLNIHLAEKPKLTSSLFQSVGMSTPKMNSLTSSGNEKSLTLDDLSTVDTPKSIGTPKSPLPKTSLLDDGSVHSKHWDRIQSMIMLSRNMADKNEEKKSARKIRGEREKHSYNHVARRSSVVLKAKQVVDQIASPYSEDRSSNENFNEVPVEQPAGKDNPTHPLKMVPSVPPERPTLRKEWRIESGVVREGREWANVIVSMQERQVSPKKNYKALNRWRDWNPTPPVPRSSKEIQFHDVDIDTGQLWTWNRFRGALIKCQKDDEQKSGMGKRSGKDRMRLQMWNPQLPAKRLDKNDFDAIVHNVSGRAGRHEFPLLVAETVSVLNLLWSMKDNDDDLYVCTSSIYIVCRMNNTETMGFHPKEHRHRSEVIGKYAEPQVISAPLVEFGDYIELLVKQRHGRTAFVHVRSVDTSPEYKQAVDKWDKSSKVVLNETLVRGLLLLDNVSSTLSNRASCEQVPNSSPVKDHDDLMSILRRTSQRTLLTFLCPHIKSQCQIGVGACRACSMRAYERYSHGASGDYQMSKGLSRKRSKLTVRFGDVTEFFQPYTQVETIAFIKFLGEHIPDDLHPIFMAHDKHMHWNVVRYFGSVLQAVRLLLSNEKVSGILIGWSRMTSNVAPYSFS
jgi:hypothetical protein